MSAAKPSATIRYTLMRLSIFVGCLAVVAVAVTYGVLPSGLGGSNVMWIILLALLLSAPLSYILLRKQRDEMSAQIAPKIDRAKARLTANQGQEDGVAP
ncbi:DUF4229 domain-containing protein [Streptomyces sp. 061-3]|uniref:DUF4229 domain-containing protein n=1 Tax=Streptomyces sp. 061-3 TaxID=2789268 RepID=UPI00397FCC9C